MSWGYRHSLSFSKVGKVLVFIILIVLNCFALRNFLLLSKDIVYGDLSAKQVYPRPRYSLTRLPKSDVTEEYEAVNRLAADFAQVYFPAQRLSDLVTAYENKKSLDPWLRPSRYAPAVILLCATTICKLNYGPASLFHMLFQIVCFFLALYLAFQSLNIKHYYLICVLFANLCLFLTPVGLSWFERGQFSLYVACSYIFLLLGFIRKRAVWVVVAALLSFIKWTSFPVVAIILIVYVLNSRNSIELGYALKVVALYASVIMVLYLLPVLFVHGSIAFLNGLIRQEVHDNPSGLSLLKFLPRYVVKLLPLVLIVFGYWNIRNVQNTLLRLMPYMTGIITIMLLYPTRASDYSAPILLSAVPFILFWQGQSEFRDFWLRRILSFIYFVFIAFALFSFELTNSSILTVIIVYSLISIVLVVAPSGLMWLSKSGGISSFSKT